MSENGGSLKYVYDKSQGSIAKHLSCGGLLHYKFTIQFAGERIYKIGEHLLNYYHLTASFPGQPG